ncbi:MAG: hypothetical protein K2G55_16040 [Lachnospiraceae bacterium]|nr:hypothetical protein [Lachnospiraceae bacterium]MDE7202250.1 hypothetical protein [Lachnospiraceae bacterium]
MEVLRKIYPYDLGVRVEIPVEKMGEELSGQTYTGEYQSGRDAIFETVIQSDNQQMQADTLQRMASRAISH